MLGRKPTRGEFRAECLQTECSCLFTIRQTTRTLLRLIRLGLGVEQGQLDQAPGPLAQ